MKMAIISDIHGNLPALEAVYRHIQDQKPDAVYCLGDLVNQNVWNNEVVEFINVHNIPCVLGNHDEGIGNDRKNFPFAYSLREEEAWGKQAIAYTLQHVTIENKKYLKHLPLSISFYTLAARNCVMMVHGTPDHNTERIYRFSKEQGMSKIMDDAKADILLVGNTHCSFHKIIEKNINEQKHFQHVINPGSVGCPKDGSWHACYAVISLSEKKNLCADADAVKVNFYRLDYDINKVIKAIQHTPLPIFYAGRLLKY